MAVPPRSTPATRCTVPSRRYRLAGDRPARPDYSFLIQDEPEIGLGFSYKMSLRGRSGMLGVDHQDGRFRSDESGADSGISGRSRRGAVRRTEPGGGIRLDGTNAGAFRIWGTQQAGKGPGAAVHRTADRSEPRAVDTPDCQLHRHRARQASPVSAQDVSHPLHQLRRGSAGLRGPKPWKPERSGDEANPGTGVPRVWSGSLRAPGADLGGANLPLSQLGIVSQTQYQLPADAAHADPDRRAAQTAAGRPSRISAHRCGPRGDAVGDRGCHAADLGTLADSGTGADLGPVPVRDSRVSLRQRQRVRQLHGGAVIGETAHRADQIAGASQRRQRTGGVEEWSGDSQTSGLRPHRCAARRANQSVSSAVFESLPQLPPAVRRSPDRRRTERQTAPHLPALGHSLRDLPPDAGMRKVSEARRQSCLVAAVGRGTNRYRGGHRDAAGQTETLGARETQRLRRADRRKARQRGGNAGRWKARKTERQVFLPSHRPWKSLWRFPHSHRADSWSSLSKSKTKNENRKELPAAGHLPSVQAHPSMRESAGLPPHCLSTSSKNAMVRGSRERSRAVMASFRVSGSFELFAISIRVGMPSPSGIDWIAEMARRRTVLSASVSAMPRSVATVSRPDLRPNAETAWARSRGSCPLFAICSSRAAASGSRLAPSEETARSRTRRSGSLSITRRSTSTPCFPRVEPRYPTARSRSVCGSEAARNRSSAASAAGSACMAMAKTALPVLPASDSSSATLCAGCTSFSQCTGTPPASTSQSAETARMRSTAPSSMRSSTSMWSGGSRCTTPLPFEPPSRTYWQSRPQVRTAGADQPIHAGCGRAASSERNAGSRPPAAERVSTCALTSSLGCAAILAASATSSRAGLI